MVNEFLKELNIEGVAEIIAEKFDNAIDFMHPNAIVYGGAIRDVLAGMPLEGDLDIATDGHSHKRTVRNFRSSTKWTEQGRRRHAILKLSKQPSEPQAYRQGLPEFLREAPGSSYKGADMPVADIISFVTFDNAKTQIIMAKGQTKDSFDAALEIVKHVDFVCCGLMMDNTGRIFEIIEGAYEDCKNRVLRLNKTIKNINIDNLKERIAKLKKRGWESKVNIGAAKRKMEKAHKARIADQERFAKSQQKHTKTALSNEKSTEICSFITVKESKTGPFKNYSIHFDRRAYTQSYVGESRNFARLPQILDVISNVAYKAKVKIAHKPGRGDNIIIRILQKKITSKRVNYFAKELQEELEELAASYSGIHKKKTMPKRKRAHSNVHVVHNELNLSDTKLSAKLRGMPISTSGSNSLRTLEEMPDDEVMPEAATRAEYHPSDVDIETMSFKATMAPDGQIIVSPTEVDPNAPVGEVTIDVDSLSPEAAEQLRTALENENTEDIAYEEYQTSDTFSDIMSIGEDPDERNR